MPIGWYVIEPPLSGAINTALKKPVSNFSGHLPISGTSSITLKKVISTFSGSQTTQGSQVVTLKKVVFTGSGFEKDIDGEIQSNLKKIVASLTGTQVVTGTQAVTLKKLSSSFIGSQILTATISSALKKLTASVSGVMVPSGEISSTLQNLDANFVADGGLIGEIISTLKRVDAILSGTQTISGVQASVLARLVVSLTGTYTNIGQINSTIPKLSAGLIGNQPFNGVILSSLKPVSITGSGTQELSGTITSTLKKQVASLNGSQSQSGVAAIALKKMIASLNGSQSQQGVVSSLLKKLTASFAGEAVAFEQPNEYYDDFTAKTPAALTAGIQAWTSDSGHTMYATGTTNGSFKASSKDGTVVLAHTSDSTAGAIYYNASIPGWVYGWARMRFVSTPSKTGHGSALGIIPWTVVNQNSEACSGAHGVIAEDSTVFQRVVNAGDFTAIGGPWSYTDVGEAWFEVELAIKGNDLVVRLPDGTIQTYNNSALTTYRGNWFCIEPVKNAASDWQPEISHAKASTLRGMNAAQRNYYNALLALGGVSPETDFPTPAISGSPILVATGGVTAGTAGNGNPTFQKVSDGTTYTCVAGDLMVRVDFNDDTQTLSVQPTGFTTARSQQNGGACSLVVSSKVATGGETATGPPASGSAADTTVVLVFQSCSGIGAVNGVSESTATKNIPVLSSLTNSPSGKSRKLYAMGRRGLTALAEVAPPEGYDTAKTQQGTASGANSVIGTYLSYSNVTSDTARTFSDAGGAQYSCGISIELLGV